MIGLDMNRWPVRCPTCNSASCLDLGKISFNSNKLCVNCFSLFHLSASEDESHHDPGMTADRYLEILNCDSEQQNYRYVLSSISGFLPKSTKKHTLHDVGCGTGHFLKAARDYGFQVSGNDIWNDMIEIVKKENLDAYLGIFDSRKHTNLSVITYLCVIAHMDNPWKSLQESSLSLMENGVIYLHTPRLCLIDYVSLFLYFISFKRYSKLLYRRINKNHRIIYSSRALKIAIKNAGFDILRIKKTQGYGLKYAAYLTSLSMGLKKVT